MSAEASLGVLRGVRAQAAGVVWMERAEALTRSCSERRRGPSAHSEHCFRLFLKSRFRVKVKLSRKYRDFTYTSLSPCKMSPTITILY